MTHIMKYTVSESVCHAKHDYWIIWNLKHNTATLF